MEPPWEVSAVFVVDANVAAFACSETPPAVVVADQAAFVASAVAAVDCTFVGVLVPWMGPCLRDGQ